MAKKKIKKAGKKVPAMMHKMKDIEVDAMMKEEKGMKEKYMGKKKFGKYKR